MVRKGGFRIEIDRAFESVMRACAEAERDPDDPGSWISDEIVRSYCALHERGLAHSVEAWRGDRLVGGLYGVSLGGAFFGESMFHRETDASKVALVALVERLRGRGYLLLDTQWVTEHLEQFGAIEIPRRGICTFWMPACAGTARSPIAGGPASMHGVRFAEREGRDLRVELLAADVTIR